MCLKKGNWNNDIMNIDDEEISEQIYNSGIISDMESSEEYKKVLRQYNELYESIKDEELETKFRKLEELKSKVYSEVEKSIFKLGFSMATKMIMEGLNFNTKNDKIN